MLFSSRVTSISYDRNTQKFEGEVLFHYPNGITKTLRATVVGPQRWPFERVSRELLFAARFRALRTGPAELPGAAFRPGPLRDLPTG